MSFPRYPAYKDSGVEWLGEVPEHWEIIQLKRIGSIRYGIGEPPAYVDEGTRLIRATNVRAGNLSDAGMVYVNPADIPSQRILWLEGGDIVIVRSGAYTGDSAIIPLGYGPCIAGFDMVLKIHASRPNYVQYALLGAYVKDFQIELERMRAAQPHLNAEELGECLFLMPPPTEQSAIVNFLDYETAKIDALIAEQQRLIELLQEKRQAVISHAVTKGLNPDAPMKDSGVEWLGEVPEHWVVCPVKCLARIGNGSTPNRENSDYWTDDGFPWLNSSVVNQAEVSEAERFVTQLALKECHLPIIEPPAVLVGITGQGKTRGMAAPLRFVATLNQHVAYIKPDAERLGVDYLQRALEAAYNHLRIESEGVGSTKGAITCEQLGAWKLPIPCFPEQAVIVLFLKEEVTRLDTLKGESERAIALLQERRSALISAAVTGQIDVRGFVQEDVAA